MIAFLADGNEWAAERLAREPGWVLDSALRDGNVKAFAAYMNQASAHEISELRLGKKTEELYVEAEKLHKQITPHSYGGPPIRFTEEDVDQARAAGVLIEFERGAAIIVDRPLYRELVKSAVKRTVEQLRVKVAELAEQRKQDRKRTGGAPVDPVAEAHRERDRQLRELAEQAHGVNLDLGDSLMNNLSTVDPASMGVARFFILGRHRPKPARPTSRLCRCAAPSRLQRVRRSCGASGRRHSRAFRREAGRRSLRGSDLLRKSSRCFGWFHVVTRSVWIFGLFAGADE